MYDRTIHCVTLACRNRNYPWNTFFEREITEIKIDLETLPEDCVGFRFYDLFLYDEGDEKVRGTLKRNMSSWTYFGKEYTLDEIKAQFPEKNALITEMENNRLKRVAILENGGIQYLEDNDIVISKQ